MKGGPKTVDFTHNSNKPKAWMKQNNMTFLPFKFPLCPQLECNENVREIGYHLTILERLDCHNIKYVARNIIESSVEI